MGKEVLNKKIHVIDSGIDIENARDEKNIPEFEDKLANKSSGNNTTRYTIPIFSVTFVAILSALGVGIFLFVLFPDSITSCFSSVDVKFVTVDSGYYSGINEKITEVFRSTADFEFFWARHTSNLSPSPEAPGIDFQKEMVIAIFRGTQSSSGLGLEITHIVENGGGIVVKYETRDTSLDENQMDVMTQPFQIVKVQFSTKGVCFNGSDTSSKDSSDVKFTAVDSGYYSAIEQPLTEVFHSNEDFESFWAMHTSNLSPPPEVPGIDFQKEMVIAVFRGTQSSGGYKVEITNIIDQNTEIVVKYETRNPSPDEDVMSVMTQPFQIVKVQSSTKGVSFEGSDIPSKEKVEIPFTTVSHGYYSGIKEPLTKVFYSNEDFESFWAMHTSNLSPPPEVPEIDFQNEMVIAVFRGTQETSGYDVNITDIVDNNYGMVITYETKDPCPDSVTAMVLTQPFHIIQVQLSTNSVFFGGHPIDC